MRNSSFLIDTVSKVLFDIFNKPIESVPLKFGKYFISIVNKICSIEFIVSPIPEKKILTLVEQLLLKLLTPGLEQQGEKNEGQTMFRNLNSSILRILENCHPTIVFFTFLSLLRKYKGCQHIKKLSGIIVKCLLKVTKIIPEIIDEINIERILLAIHEYLLAPSLNPSDSSGDEVGIRITKTIVNELVKLKRETIWNYYEGVESHPENDIYIKRWIDIILKSQASNMARPQTAQMPKSDLKCDPVTQAKFDKVLAESQSSSKFYNDQAFRKLSMLRKIHPQFPFDEYLQTKY